MSGWRQVEDPGEVRRIKQTLAALPRLRVYEHPELYDLAYPGFPGDDEFYGNLAGRGRVLYLGVGTGRLFARIARANPQAVGIDNSPRMVEALRARHADVRAGQVLLASSVDAPFEASSFDAVIAPFCFLEALDEATLANVARWLKPGGAFHTDTFSTFLIPFRRPGLESLSFRPRPGCAVEIFVEYDHVGQRMRESAVVRQDRLARAVEMDLTYLFPREIVTAVVRAGLSAPAVHGGYRGEAFDPCRSEIAVYSAVRGQ